MQKQASKKYNHKAAKHSILPPNIQRQGEPIIRDLNVNIKKMSEPYGSHGDQNVCLVYVL